MLHLSYIDNVKYVLVCHELHKDGTDHLHALISFDKKRDIRNEKYFDIDNFHPNIQSVKSMPKSINYIKKDKDFVEWGENTTASKFLNFPEGDEHTLKTWLEECMERKIPYGYAAAMWKCKSVSNFTTLETFDHSNASRISNLLLKVMLPDLTHLRSYVILGPSGCGKTTWCKMHANKPALMVSHMDDLRDFKIGFHKSIIFDDMKFTHLDPVLQIPIVDRYDNRSLHCRYNVAQIPAGIQKFFTCNEMPFNTEHEQIKRRITIINLFKTE